MSESEARKAKVDSLAMFYLGAACVGVVWLVTLATEKAWPNLFCVGAY